MTVDTKQVILDTAEKLISDRGIDAVSLRTITATAQVNLAAVHYHFGSKEALVGKVFERRIGPLNQRRLEMLDAAESEADGEPVAVEVILGALMEPAIRLYQGDADGRQFMRMCGRIYAEPAEYLEPVFENLFAEIVMRFTAAFAKALPQVPEVDRAWRIHFSVGTLIHTMIDSERLKRFSHGMCDPGDTEAVIEKIVRFCAAGMRAEAGGPAKKTRRRPRSVAALGAV